MIAAVAADDLPMVRVILYRVDGKPCVTWLAADPGGGHKAALETLLGIPVARVELHDNIEVIINRNGLLLGIGLARDALATSPEPPRYDVAPRADVCDVCEPELEPADWPVSADILLARVVDGELVDLTDADVRFLMFWLGYDWLRRR